MWTIIPASAAEIVLEFVPASSAARCEVTAVVVTSPVAPSKVVPLTPFVVVGGAGGAARVTLDGFPVELAPVAAGCWAPPLQLVADPVVPVVTELWPSATVLGGISFERKGEKPKKIEASFIDVAADRGSQRVACELDAEVWRCEVPAGRPLHLKIAIDNFAPLFVWDVSVQPGAVQDTGIQTLVRGAAISGLGVLDRGRPAVGANVRLLPLTAGHQTPVDRAAKRHQTKTNARGHFQFTGVEPGVYRLVSALAGRGDAVLEAVEIRPGEHLELREPLVHRELAELTLLLQPPVAPSQMPWSVELFRDGEREFEVVPVTRGPASVDGYWTRNGLQPMSYNLRILDADGSRVVSQEILLRGGREQITVDVATIGVAGRVLAGDGGIAAEVKFESEGRSVRSKSDGEGAFTIAFPGAGTWTPSVSVGTARVRLETVEIKSPHEDELILRLPGGRVRGRVLDQTGRPASNVLVRLTRAIRSVSSAYSDETGEFHLIGVEGGQYSISAETDETFGGPLPLTAREDETAEIEIRLEPWKEVTGVVTTASGAAASGAVVRNFDASTGLMEDTIADGRGAFSFRVTPRSATIELIVLAPPHPIAMRRIALAERRVTSAHVQLSAEGTRLRVYILRSPPWPVLTGPDGVARSLGLLLMPLFGRSSWREFVEGGFNFFIEPGPYVICGNGTPPCQQLQLAAHAETTVHFLNNPVASGTN
ncbi:MAG TPA: carboxypeptidase-like regulatory domain-containing protein [Thermoanaerobaculia bacterium]|nr:carboxypeptidase-like regulatory domain-containing protein [Thermoanaerobaculia bacterium]